MELLFGKPSLDSKTEDASWSARDAQPHGIHEQQHISSCGRRSSGKIYRVITSLAGSTLYRSLHNPYICQCRIEILVGLFRSDHSRQDEQVGIFRHWF